VRKNLQETILRPRTSSVRGNLAMSTVSSSGDFSTGKTRTCWSRSRGGPQKWIEGWNSSPMRKDWETWGCSACRTVGWSETLEQPFSAWRGPSRKPERDFLLRGVVIGQRVMTLNWKRVDLD